MTTTPSAAPASRGEGRVVLLAAAAQLLVLLDFAVLLPLGPDLVEPLQIPASSLGLLLAAYTAAAATSGMLSSRVLDHFDRRRALFVAVAGLTVASASASLATGFTALLCARIAAGVFGAPASALIMSLVTDEVPVARRGRAISTVLSANAIGGVIGVPACLWLAQRLGWWTAFVFVGVVGLGVTLAVALSIRERVRAGAEQSLAPRLRHLRSSSPPAAALVGASHALLLIAFVSMFALTVNLSAFVQLNLDYPRANLPGLYMAAAAVALVMIRLAGPAVDRVGAFAIGSVAMASVAAVVVFFLLLEPARVPVAPAFILLLACVGARNVAIRTLTSRVPDAGTRARFMAVHAAMRQLGAVGGVLVGLVVLDDAPDGRLSGMPTLALVSLILFALIPPLLAFIEGKLDAAESAAAAS